MKTVKVQKDNTSKAWHKPRELNRKQMLSDQIKESWSLVAPFWPLENLIAVNPLLGFEHMPFEEAIKEACKYFRQPSMEAKMEEVNRITIKWCQAFFDQGQASIPMPDKHLGLYVSWKKLSLYDTQIHKNQQDRILWLKALSDDPEDTINRCLEDMAIKESERSEFLKLMLFTLPGWASHIRYLSGWTSGLHHKNVDMEYLALRLAITRLLWPEAGLLLDKGNKNTDTNPLQPNLLKEELYCKNLIKMLGRHWPERNSKNIPDAQFIFCIDVRSEPFRRSLEAMGNYETFGFAGFFGLPIEIQNQTQQHAYASCPVLLKPTHKVYEQEHKGLLSEFNKTLWKLYDSVKYTFTSPFALVEASGPLFGAHMLKRNLFSGLNLSSNRGKDAAGSTLSMEIPLKNQCAYAEAALRMMGLTERFAPKVFICGHGSRTENNIFASSLDCGACGGRHGAINARALATCLNSSAVRDYLVRVGISIPEKTIFIAAEHNTTTDEVQIFADTDLVNIDQIKTDLEKAQQLNKSAREFNLGNSLFERSSDWAQVRPEWGLARNAGFIVAPRSRTEELNLEGRCFLHSYDWKLDPDGTLLTTILTAPMRVAQWINYQYLFSTIDNVTFGAGSKVTANVTGKHGVMQGNASDLMSGLPLQSVYSTDQTKYHEPLRLLTVVYAPTSLVTKVIHDSELLRILFGNGWVNLICSDTDGNFYRLTRDLEWKRFLS